MNERYVLAIDPGNKESGFCILDAEDYRPLWHAKMENNDFLWKVEFDHMLDEWLAGHSFKLAIEMIASYGMAVGAEVFETCVWIGKFAQFFLNRYGIRSHYIYRKEEKLNLCGSPRANDSNISQALADRFAPGEKNHGKGTKAQPGWFYGFSKDQWAAYAVGVTFIDKTRGYL